MLRNADKNLPNVTLNHKICGYSEAGKRSLWIISAKETDTNTVFLTQELVSFAPLPCIRVPVPISTSAIINQPFKHALPLSLPGMSLCSLYRIGKNL